MELKIDQGLSSFQRRLTQEEFDQLEENILKDGAVIQPIVVWKDTGIIVDGENRYTIAKKHSLPFEVHEMEFADQSQAILWAVSHQLGRRNLDGMGTAMLRAELHKKTGDVQAVADAFGVTRRQVYRDALMLQGISLLPDDLRQRYERGGLAATQGGFRKLIDLSEDQRDLAFNALRSDNECSLDEAIPKQREAVVMTDQDNSLAKQIFSPSVRRSLAAGTIGATDSDMAKLRRMSGDKQVLVADLLETGDIRNLGEAIEVTEEPKKKRSPKVDVDKLRGKVAECFGKLRRCVDDLGLALGLSLDEVHDALNIAEDNIP